MILLHEKSRGSPNSDGFPMSHFHTLHGCFASPKSISTVQTPGGVGSGWTAVHSSFPSHDVSIFQPIFTDLPTFTYMFTNIKTYMFQINPGFSGYKNLIKATSSPCSSIQRYSIHHGVIIPSCVCMDAGATGGHADIS